MNNDPYDTSVGWVNFHSQQTEDISQQANTIYPLTPAYQREKIKAAPSGIRRLSKSEALERASYLKGFVIVATLLGFGTLGGLVANQIFNTNISSSPVQTAPAQQAPSGQTPAGPSDAGGFFRHHGGGGYGFGQGNNTGNGTGNNAGPFSGSHTS